MQDSPVLATIQNDDGSRQAIGWVEMPGDLREDGEAAGAMVLYEEPTAASGFGAISDNCEPWEAWAVLLTLCDEPPTGQPLTVFDDTQAAEWYDMAAASQN